MGAHAHHAKRHIWSHLRQHMGAWVYPTAGDNVLDRDVVKFSNIFIFMFALFLNLSRVHHDCSEIHCKPVMLLFRIRIVRGFQSFAHRNTFLFERHKAKFLKSRKMVTFG